MLPEEKSPKPERAFGDTALLTFLIYVSIILIIILFALPLIDSIAVDPQTEYVAMLVLILIASTVLAVRVYPARSPHHGALQPELLDVEVRSEGPVKARADVVRSALEGRTYSRILALQELRELLIRRMMLRRHLARGEMESLMRDARWLRWTLNDEDLKELLEADLRGAVPQASLDPKTAALVSDFDIKFELLVKKVEGFN
ncbi:MAG TPA: hypothetical protein VMB46_03020 [Methanomassiliicoccales archaeon]|nr:hypothetical protein [Methanomassiliicoccales archaeon]